MTYPQGETPLRLLCRHVQVQDARLLSLPGRDVSHLGTESVTSIFVPTSQAGHTLGADESRTGLTDDGMKGRDSAPLTEPGVFLFVHFLVFFFLQKLGLGCSQTLRVSDAIVLTNSLADKGQKLQQLAHLGPCLRHLPPGKNSIPSRLHRPRREAKWIELLEITLSAFILFHLKSFNQ